MERRGSRKGMGVKEGIQMWMFRMAAVSWIVGRKVVVTFSWAGRWSFLGVLIGMAGGS